VTQQLVVAALAAAQPQEAVGRDAALQEGLELVLDEPGQFRPGAGLGVSDGAGCVLLRLSASVHRVTSDLSSWH
jgi:hypothetical protein